MSSLSPDLNERLTESDRHRAAQYTSMEALAARWAAIAQEIEESDDSIPEPVDDADDDSLVYHLELAGRSVAAR